MLNFWPCHAYNFQALKKKRVNPLEMYNPNATPQQRREIPFPEGYNVVHLQVFYEEKFQTS